MATVLDYNRKDYEQIAEGLSKVIPGSPPAANIAGLSTDALTTYLRLSRANIDRNAGQRNEVPTEGVLSADTVRRTPGAKDRALGTISEIKANPNLLSDPAYMQQYQALIGAVGGPLDHDWDTVSAEESAYLPTLEARLNSGVSLNTIFANSAAEAEAAQQAALEAAADAEAEQRAAAEVKSQAVAGLVYAGYLKPEDANSLGAAEYAMKRLIVANIPQNEWGAEQGKLFTNGIGGEMTPYAVSFLQDHIGGFDNNSADLKADLESGDAARITQAQSYLNLMGADVEVNGTYDRATADAALANLHAPLTMPEGILVGGNVDYNALYEGARAGMIALPMNDLNKYLPADVVEVANLYPLASETNDPMAMTREAFVAERMIADDPARYERFLTDENTRRAALMIDAEIQLPVVEIAPETPEVVERNDIAQNPAGIIDTPSDDAVTDAAQPIVDAIRDQGLGVTSANDYVVWGGKSVGLSAIAVALRENHGLVGDGVADDKMSVQGAIALTLEVVTGDPGSMINPDDIRDIEESLGLMSNQKLDVTNPMDMKTLLQGVVSYKDTLAGRMEGKSFEESSTIMRPDVAAAIERAAGLTPSPATTPVIDPATSEKIRLHQYFNGPAEGLPAAPALISRADPAMTPVADNRDAPKFDMAG